MSYNGPALLSPKGARLLSIKGARLILASIKKHPLLQMVMFPNGLSGRIDNLSAYAYPEVPDGSVMAIDAGWHQGSDADIQHNYSATFYHIDLYNDVLGFGIGSGWPEYVSAMRLIIVDEGAGTTLSYISKCKITGPVTGTLYYWDNLGTIAAGQAIWNGLFDGASEADPRLWLGVPHTSVRMVLGAGETWDSDGSLPGSPDGATSMVSFLYDYPIDMPGAAAAVGPADSEHPIDYPT